ncbi:MAG: flagellar motor protein MotB, partial [Candidatus Accumulibacter sp.]|nr:flagellar motor protein MotB [Accumulibacter sp.]
AWKLAYADFVTAMMAFFLLMWLLGSVSSGDLKGLSEFFQNPLRVSFGGGSGTGDAMSILKGGGKDISSSSGYTREGEVRRSGAANLKGARTEELRKEFEEREKRSLGNLKSNIEGMIAGNLVFQQFKSQMMVDVVPEGLRVQIIDEQNRPMFDTSSAEPAPYFRTILREIGQSLNSVPNKISISGHTDAAQYGSGVRGFSNWELSVNRANAARREMIAGGMDENKVFRVVGFSSIILFDRNDPLSPSNRRINITVLNKRTEEAMLQEDADVAENPDTQSQTPEASWPPGRT